MKKAVSILCITLLALMFCACNYDDFSWRRGLFTTLSLSVDVLGDEVVATVRNDFTLGLATVPVTVELYNYSATETLATATKQASKKSDNLVIFSTLTATAEVGEYGNFWFARLRYKDNDNSWREITTEPIFVLGTEDVR